MNSVQKLICFAICIGLLNTIASDSLQAQRTRPTNSAENDDAPRRPDRGFVKPPTKLDFSRFVEERGFSEGGEEFRTYNGISNNLDRPREGSIFINLIRIAPSAYGPNNSLARQDQLSPREISNAVSHQSASIFNDRSLSDFAWQWGQFIDHDLDLTEFQSPAEGAPIAVPNGDAVFDPFSTGAGFIPFNRSVYTLRLIRSNLGRQQLNEITAWIDASNVYGSEQAVADSLRTFVNGRLRTLDGGAFGDLMPLNKAGTQYQGGDIRAAEQAGLTCMHTLFMREHNRLANEIKINDPNASDEEIFQRARKENYAILEAITFNEWLPALFGPSHPLNPYAGYNPAVSPNIANEFSTAAFRIGHTMLNNQLLRLDNNGDPIPEGHILLREAFFNRSAIESVGIDCYLKGMMSQRAQEIDAFVIGAVRNFLFSNQPESPMGFDLASLNIQRGRDHGLPDFNTVRVAYGLPALNSFADLTSDPLLQAKLASVYDTVDDLDPWIGFLAEDRADQSSLGATVIAALQDQFERIRDADRFWYENVYSGKDLDRIRNTTLADVIQRNTNLTNVQDKAFFVE